MKYFNTVRQKLRRKIVILPRLLSKIFRDQKLVKHQKIPLRNFSALWDKKFSIENLETPPPPPLLSINFFATGKFLKYSTEGFTYQIYRHCETKNFRRKKVIPLVCIKFFDTPNFLKHRRDAHEYFQDCETKNFRRKNVIPPSMHKFFRYPKFSETFKGCPRNFLPLWDQKFSAEKRDTPFFIHIFFETKNFLKNSRISLRKFWALWDIKISTGNRDMPPLIHKFFSIPEIFRKTEGFLYKAFRFGPVRQKFRQNRDAPLLFMKIFDKRIFLKHQSVLQWNISIQWDKNCDGKSWYSPVFYSKFFGTRN